MKSNTIMHLPWVRGKELGKQWRERMDQYWFRRRRAIYFSYLSALLDGLQGSRTLRDVFADDVLRYGRAHPRGRLAILWIKRYVASGGSLFEAWRGCVPYRERSAIEAAQRLGNTALGQALSNLARVVRLEDELRTYVRSTMVAAWGAFIVLCLVLALIPNFSVPRLLDTFTTVPTALYGPSTQTLLALSSHLQRKWWLFLGGLLLLALWVRWSLDAYCGPARHVLDRLPPWSLYRQRHGLSFLFMLQLTLQTHDNSRIRLRQALEGQRAYATAWLDTHLQGMLARVDEGVFGAGVFETGLLEREHIWFLDDMVRAQGMTVGIHLTEKYLEQGMVGAIRRQALVLRWALLLSCVLLILGVVLWHYSVIDELRRALMLMHS